MGGIPGRKGGRRARGKNGQGRKETRIEGRSIANIMELLSIQIT